MGTVLARAVVAVGDAVIGSDDMLMEFRLLENVAPVAVI
jgi:hypothetical protein